MPSVERTITVATPSSRVRDPRVDPTDPAEGDPFAGRLTAPGR
jgi:hypothetical protein